jgi:hypothetical protein
VRRYKGRYAGLYVGRYEEVYEAPRIEYISLSLLFHGFFSWFVVDIGFPTCFVYLYKRFKIIIKNIM